MSKHSIKVILVLIFCASLLIGARTADASENIYSAGPYTCDKNDSSGNCPSPYSVFVNIGEQAWKGTITANLRGTAGLIGPGNVTIYACLSVFGGMYEVSSDCWLLFNQDLENNSFNLSTARDIGNGQQNRYSWVVQISGDEFIASDVNIKVYGRKGTIDSLSAQPNPVYTGDEIQVDWATNNTDNRIIAWSGAVQNPGDSPAGPTGPKTLIAGSTPGTATFTLTANGPGGSGYGPLTPKTYSIDVIANPATQYVNLKFKVSDSCVGNFIQGVYMELPGLSSPKYTDANGEATFSVRANSSVIWYASKTGYTSQNSTVQNVGSSDSMVPIQLVRECGSGGPTVDVKFNGSDTPDPIQSGDSGTVSWVVANAASCTATGEWSGPRGTSGGSENSGVLNSQATFTLTCSSPNGAVGADSVTVDVGTGGGGDCQDNKAENFGGPLPCVYKYSCSNGQNSVCEVKNNGQYTTSNCNNACATPTPSVPYGNLDIGDCKMYGWAYDPDTPNGQVKVNVYKDGHSSQVGDFYAGSYRSDLKAAGQGNGDHAFDAIDAPAILQDGTHTLYLYPVDTTSNQEAPNPLGSYTYNFSSCKPNVPAYGSLDGLSCWYGGWAYDENSTTTPVHVEVYKDGTLQSGAPRIDEFDAGDYRSDLEAVWGSGKGNHAFTRYPPDSANLSDGTHTLYFYAKDIQTGNKALFGQASYNFNSCINHLPIGYLDTPNYTDSSDGCSVLGGWAIDQDADNGNTPIEVHIYDGTTLIGSLVTNTLRGDVNTSYGISGNHGYTVDTPSSLKNNQQHVIHAFGVDANTGQEKELTSSPKTILCQTVDLDFKVKESDAENSAYATEITIDYNESVTLKWTPSRANSCTADIADNAWSGSKSPGGGLEDKSSLTSSKTYKLKCLGNYGSEMEKTVKVNVNPAPVPTVDIKANGSDNPASIDSNDSATISWTSSVDVQSCTVSPGGWTGKSGSKNTGPLTQATTYTADCVGLANQPATDSVTVPLNATVTVTASPNPVTYGTTTTLTWSSTNTVANSCAITGGAVSGSSTGLATSGTKVTGNLTSATTYTVTCNGTNGSPKSGSVLVNVGGAPTMTYFRCNGVNTNGTCSIDYGGTATITWSSSNTTGCSLVSTVPTDDYVSPFGTRNDTNITGARDYSIECWNNVSNIHAPALPMPLHVAINGPSMTLTASQTSLAWNNTGTTLSWTSTSAGSCNATGSWSGPKTPVAAGSYPTGHLEPGSYTYTLTCTGTSATSKTVVVDVTPPTPSVPSDSVTVAQPNYCASGPSATINWVYSDPANSPQTKYQVQITNTGSFNSPIIDTGQISSSAKSYNIGTGILQFNTTYRARVRVWNSYNSVSDWGTSNSWKTPIYAYPQVGMSWLPKKPGKNQPVQFTDRTVFADGNPNQRTWSWSFGDGGTSTTQNPSHTYADTGSYSLRLTVTDAAGQSCSTTGSGTIQGIDPIICNANCGIDVQKPIPKIKEVAPQ